MHYLNPHYVNTHQSDLRAIKDGWYAMDDDGNLVSGPFSSRKECVEGTIQPNGSMPSALF
jgi:hypothetical protein